MTNGKSPNLTDFTQTIPNFKCEQTRSECIKDCGPTDTQCQDGCKDVKCGSKNPQEGKGSTTKSEGLPGRKYTGILQGDLGAAALVSRYYAIGAMLIAVVGGSFVLL
ncbi:hypothetical protein KEM55_004622 [Ascosphaera atra]|nr:hypothetical protein KEM55_004622 [Ascosphaera atra]